jgi:hypothetical protein
VSLHGELWAQREVLVALAGPSAQRKARQTLAPLSWELEKSYHEAGHSLIALKLQMFVWEVSIIPDRESKIGKNGNHQEGLTRYGYVRRDEVPIETKTEELSKPRRVQESDHRIAARYCLLLGQSCSWRDGVRTYHQLRARADELVDKYWIQIVALGGELRRHWILDEIQIREIIRQAEA